MTHVHYLWSDVKTELGLDMLLADELLEIPKFEWELIVPTWVVLEYMKHKPEGSVIMDWKPTPKGGKLHSVDGKGIAHVRQYIRK